MKKTESAKKFLTYPFLIITVLIALFFSLYHYNSAPPGFNADEAAFGYNAYSLLQTGADEYGTQWPLRLKSFNDYKMPLYSYFSMPFIGTMGLNELSTRMLNIVLSVLFPLVMYLFIKELFGRKEIGVIGAFIISSSLGLSIVHRHAHEAFLAVFLLTFASYFYIRFLKKESYKYAAGFLSLFTLSLFAYQSSRIYAVFFLLFSLGYFFLQKKFSRTRNLFLIFFVIAVGLFAITDLVYKPERLSNLLLFTEEGFGLKVKELQNEGGNPLLYNKVTIGLQEVIDQHLTYYSPQFLMINGDENERFGFEGMSPMTPLIYIFIFIGLYYVFKERERWRFFLLFLIIIAPLTAALSWADTSLTRSLFLFVPLICVSSYGIYQIITFAAERKSLYKMLIALIAIQGIFLYYTWDFYINHYSHRERIALAWQCGYREVADFIKRTYGTKDKYYITLKNGQPYIFMLFYLQFPPEKYQKQAVLSEPDEYGFGQVESFDKFDFSFPPDAAKEENVVLIGYPDDFNQLTDLDKSKVKKVKFGTQEIFWIYET